MSTVSYCDDSADVASITGEASGDAAIICDQSSDVFTMQRYTSSWAQIAIGGGTSPGSLKHAEFRNTTTAGGAGGDATSGSWLNYPLTGVGIAGVDNIGITFDDANDELDLVPAGEYELFGYVVLNNVGAGRVYLYNVTAAARIEGVWSTSLNDVSGYNVNGKCYFSGRFSIDDISTLELRYRVATTNAGDGLGDGASLGSMSEWFGKFELRQIEAY